MTPPRKTDFPNPLLPISQVKGLLMKSKNQSVEKINVTEFRSLLCLLLPAADRDNGTNQDGTEINEPQGKGQRKGEGNQLNVFIDKKLKSVIPIAVREII